jgi:thioredoxin-like negative regulator of GroEL
VLALVTADWCAPCQELKRTALADQQINLWIRQNVHAVYVDATKDNPVAGELKVFSLPTMLVLRDGKEVSRLEGLRGTAEVRAWLTAATGPVADWKHAHPGQPLPTGG